MAGRFRLLATSRGTSGLDLACEVAADSAFGIGVGAGDAGNGTAAPVDGAPALAAPAPGNPAQIRCEIDAIVEIGL